MSAKHGERRSLHLLSVEPLDSADRGLVWLDSNSRGGRSSAFGVPGLALKFLILGLQKHQRQNGLNG